MARRINSFTAPLWGQAVTLLIYSKKLREYKEYIQKVLRKLYENKLQVNIKKYKFYIEEILYLGIIIDKHGIKIDLEKVAAIKE